MLSTSQVYVLDSRDSILLECFFRATTYNMFDYPLLWRKGQRNELTQVRLVMWERADGTQSLLWWKRDSS